MTAPTTVHIVAACLNGASFIGQFLRSVQAQTHADWRLWVRDDGSSDDTVRVVREAASADPRIVLLHAGGPALGVVGAFGWLLDRVPADARYVMFADQDDVWLPGKIERMLAAMTKAEAAAPGPVLVHSDLVVVDESLNEVHGSFWQYAGIDPEPVTLRRLLVQNVVTGAAAMVNAALRARAGTMPSQAVFHDWWYACVAAAYGRIEAIREPTVLYRQHGGNAVGAVPGRRHWYEHPAAAWRALQSTAHLREQIARTSRQANALLQRYAADLSAEERSMLGAYARMPDQPFLRRKLDVARLRLRREHGIWRNLGVLLRA